MTYSPKNGTQFVTAWRGFQRYHLIFRDKSSQKTTRGNRVPQWSGLFCLQGLPLQDRRIAIFFVHVYHMVVCVTQTPNIKASIRLDHYKKLLFFYALSIAVWKITPRLCILSISVSIVGGNKKAQSLALMLSQIDSLLQI